MTETIKHPPEERYVEVALRLRVDMRRRPGHNVDSVEDAHFLAPYASVSGANVALLLSVAPAGTIPRCHDDVGPFATDYPKFVGREVPAYVRDPADVGARAPHFQAYLRSVVDFDTLATTECFREALADEALGVVGDALRAAERELHRHVGRAA